MKRDRLIPVEKSKKVIYLDPRGRGVDQKHYGAMALYVLAVLCALYCVGIGLFVGFGSYFFLIWGVIAAFCAAWGWILTHKSVQERIPRWIRMTFCGLVAAGILLLLIFRRNDLRAVRRESRGGSGLRHHTGSSVEDYRPQLCTAETSG